MPLPARVPDEAEPTDGQWGRSPRDTRPSGQDAMCTVTHLVVGGAVGAWTGHGALAFALGVVSHAVLDAVPHYELDDFRLDLGITLVAVGGLVGWGYWLTPVFWGALGGVLPDVEILLWKLGLLRDTQMVFPSHSGLIRHGRRLSFRGALPQVLLIMGALGCLVVLRG